MAGTNPGVLPGLTFLAVKNLHNMIIEKCEIAIIINELPYFE